MAKRRWHRTRQRGRTRPTSNVGPYRSGLEKKVADDLESRGVEFGYEVSRVEYIKSHSYTPDFFLPNGIIVEAKGYFEPSDRTKHIAVKKQHPELDIRFVFQRAQTFLSKNSKTTYAQWCIQHGFLWAEKTVPQEWLDEPKH